MQIVAYRVGGRGYACDGTLCSGTTERLMPDFQRSVSVAVAVSAKTVSVPAVYAVAAWACARQ